MIHCIYWQDCGMKDGGCCTLGLFRGKVRYDICNKVCTKRVDGKPGSPIPTPAPRPKGGPGTELKKLFAFMERIRMKLCSWFLPGSRIRAWIERWSFSLGTGCNCNSHAALMDRNGPDWCLQNLGQIVDWMEVEAHKRKLRFVRFIAKRIVLFAIRHSQTTT